jgi:hypothetical protein
MFLDLVKDVAYANAHKNTPLEIILCITVARKYLAFLRHAG